MALTNTNTAKRYLLAYNSVQFIGWSYGLLNVLIDLLERHTTNDLWINWKVSYIISIFQTLQLLEVIHCVIRIVPSNAFQTFVQILSRLVLVWGVLNLVPESRSSIGVVMMLISWPIAEITRYAYYALNTYNCGPFVLTWLRYTLFIVLYPIGTSGELITMVKVFPYVRDIKILPDIGNIWFYYHYLLTALMISYIRFYPQLYLYMLRQRSKMLCNVREKSKFN